jgi:hypothetical protein
MKTETFEGQIDSYQGKSLKTPIKFDGAVDVYENVAEAKTAGAWPNELDILETINGKMVTSAKAKEYQKATKDLKEAYEKSDDFKISQFRKAAEGMGLDAATIESMIALKFPSK